MATQQPQTWGRIIIQSHQTLSKEVNSYFKKKKKRKIKDKTQANQIFLPLNIWNKPKLEYNLDSQGKRCFFSQVEMFKRLASER